MKKIGIWMDIEKAHIVSLTEESEQMQTLFSEVEDYHPKGGSGTKFKGGPQDVVQDSKYLERKKNQMRTYFRNLAKVINDADSIALFGPSDTTEKFRKELNENQKELASKIKTVCKVDSMTDNQVKALVRNYYKDT
jgi:stalled ribosome rescue protein Dom34